MFIEYPKIETLFKRDTNGTKKLIPGDFRSSAVEFVSGLKWKCYEKIDGTNTRIMWDGHRVSFGGKTDNAQIPQFLLEKLTEMFGGEVNEELFEQTFGDKPVELFGEGYGPKIQKGGNYRSDVSFILFDVYFPESGLWLETENIKSVADTFGVDMVPFIMEGTLEEAVEFVKQKPKSTIGNANMEGLVCRPVVDLFDRRGERLVVKVKVCDFT